MQGEVKEDLKSNQLRNHLRLRLRSSIAKHLFQQLRSTGNGLFTDLLLFIGQFEKQTIQGFAGGIFDQISFHFFIDEGDLVVTSGNVCPEFW